MKLKLSGFPSGIPIAQKTFENWSLAIKVPRLWTCTPRTAEDVVAVCEWARLNGYKVRPRGLMHGFSPLTVTSETTTATKVLLVDTTVYLRSMTMIPRSGNQPSMVKAQSGATIDALMNFLEQQSGGNGAAPGYSFPHIPATGNLTIGGVLAINGHGTAIPVHGEDISTSYGSLSNRIIAFTAVVTDPDGARPDRYAIREFSRGEGDDRAFLVHLGRAFLLDATLEVVDNYNMRCQSFVDISPNVLFQAPNPESSTGHESLMTFLQTTGRAEVLWYPLSDKAWLKVWTVTRSKPHTSTAVKLPYNYPFSHSVSKFGGLFLKTIIQLWPSLTSRFSRMCTDVIAANILRSASDLWGPAKNSLLYAKETTTRLTMSGYAVQIRRMDIQEAVHDFTIKISALLQAYANNSKWPINGPVEIRVTGLDDPSTIAVGSGMAARSPTTSSLVFDNLCTKNGWDVAVWFNVLTFPGTKSSNEFYAEFESWLQERFSGDRGRLMPEWSKGWGYTKSEGAWTNEEFIETVRQALASAQHISDWDFYVQTMSKYDRYGLFTNSLLKRLVQQSAGVAADSSSS